MAKNEMKGGIILILLLLIPLWISYSLLRKKSTVASIAPISNSNVGIVPIPSFKAKRGIAFIEPLSQDSIIDPKMFKLSLIVAHADVETTLELGFEDLIPSNWSTTDHGRSVIASYVIQPSQGSNTLLVAEALKGGGIVTIVDAIGLEGEWSLSIMQSM